MSTCWRSAFTAAVLLSAAISLFPQTTAVVQISGVVSDPQGLAVGGAQVKAIQTDTGFVRTAATGSDGHYILSNLPVGPYRIEVNIAGFKTHVQRGVVLQVNTNPAVNMVLEVGSVSQAIDVTADATMAETQETSISQVIDQQRIVDLPLNGRQATQLVLLSGAAVIPPSQGIVSSKNYPGSIVISVAGGQANGTYYLMDGGDHNDKFGYINLPMPFPDALQEFSVQTNTIPASYGVRAGAVVNIVTKSGTNQIHGSLFEFLRNGATNARNFFASDRDSLKRNQFGGTLGGPVVKNKLFLFGGYQGTRIRTAPPTNTAFVPSANVMAGDFSQITSAACGRARTLLDPTTGRPFPGNFAPPSRFSPEAVALLKYVPVSNDPCGKLLYGIPQNSGEDQLIGRADWLKSERHTLFGRYFFTDFDDPGVFDGTNLLTTQRAGVAPRVQSLVFGDSLSINPTSVNSFHFTWEREQITRGPAPNIPSASDIGLKIAPSKGNFPNITVTGAFTTSCGTCSLAQINNQTFQLADDINLVLGRHQIAFGADFMRTTQYYAVTTPEAATFNFNGDFTSYPLGDFMLGLPSQFTQGNASLNRQLQYYAGFYADEQFRINSRITVNAGVRWEPYFPLIARDGEVTHFDRAAFSAGQKSTMFVNAPAGVFYPGDPGMPGKSGHNSRLANFAPRLGLIWDPKGTGRLTLRGSYGILYDFPFMEYFHRFTVGPPWGARATVFAPKGGFGNPYADVPGGNPFPQPFPPPRDAVFPSGGEFANFPMNIHLPYTQQWNLSIQRQVGKDWLLSGSYIGNKSTHRWLNNQVDPARYIPGTCGSGPCSTTANTQARRVLSLERPADGALISRIIETDDGANASYNALLISAKRRFYRNFSLLANYTWSHCVSDGDAQAEQSGTSYQNPADRNANRGNCDSDTRHLFNSSLVYTGPRFSQPIFGKVLSNWQLASIITKRSGAWLSPQSGSDRSLTGVGIDRPDVTGDWHIERPTPGRWFNTSVFKANAAGKYGNAGRGSVQAPGAFTFDLAVTREFVVRERHRFELRGEAFNVLNHARFGNPQMTLTNSNFGRILSADDPRILQFALKYSF